MSKTIEEILTPRPEARPHIYAYTIADKAHAGLLKVGQTTRNVKQRVAEQLKTANIKNYTIVLVTHILRQARRIADYVIFMYMGEVIECGTAEEVFENPKEEKTKSYLKGIFY